MKFRFRLEKMLHFERLKEVIKKGEVAKAMEAVRDIEQQQIQSEASLRTVIGLASGRLEESGDWVAYQVEKVRHDLAKLENLAQTLRVKQEDLDTVRYELSRLLMKNKALSDLREKKRHDFVQNDARREQKNNDEIFRLNGKGK